ncbi:pilus assembly protein [Micromonospora sp. NBC_01699]|uniref:TadE/TadG family type IV pilus assembly protein n=1 Tax=Micromonospora sp. NBC_01699 TaxID=2975984 RepID=UPI002E2C3C32|nr:TadE/TadG family type IV pilus assembly protein [Micromonospora sp. NBC_01699]
MAARARGRWAERGSVSVEIAILAPIFVLLFGMAVVAGRQAIAENAVSAAAHDAARASSISRTAAQAQTAGDTAVTQRLAEQGLNCQPAAAVTLSGTSAVSGGTNWSLQEAFAQPLGDPVFIVANVTCVVSYQDLAGLGLPQTAPVSARFVSPLDRYRSRG